LHPREVVAAGRRTPNFAGWASNQSLVVVALKLGGNRMISGGNIYQGMKLLGAAFLTGALSVTLGHRG
jgi:hypothetical protein